MGTDIHAQVEIKINGQWQWLLSGDQEYAATTWEWVLGSDHQAYKPKKGENPVRLYRCYSLFAILADVRNGYGTAGISTGDGFNPISTPKGLPHDLCPELRALQHERMIFGEHSFSYVTEEELAAYNWEQETIREGVTNLEGFMTYKVTGTPSNSCGHVMGGNIEIITNEEMERRIENFDLPEGKRYYTRVRWKKRYIDAVDPFALALLTNLRQVIAPEKRNDVEDIRIVFGFDS